MTRRHKQYIGLIIAAASAPALVRAQSTISYSSGTYSQSFATLPNSGTFTYTTAGPHEIAGAPIFAFDMEGWTHGNTVTANPAIFRVSPGSDTTGATYSYGAAGSIERALGSLASGTTISAFGAKFVNTGTSTLNQFTLSYTGEQWRRGTGSANTLGFSYGIDATNILATSGFTDVAQLSFTSPVITGGAGSLNGNLPANQAAITHTVDGLSWAPGQALFIRWKDADDTGSDDGLGIDNLSFSARFAPPPRNLVWNPLGAGTNNWSTNPANTNWLDGAASTSFNNGDIANFTDAGVGSVVIDAAGVAPGNVFVSNTTGVYEFQGGSINGNPVLEKSGAGQLSVANLRIGGLRILGGEVDVRAGATPALPGGVSDLGSLAIAGGPTAPTARLDLTNNAMIVSSTTAPPGEGSNPTLDDIAAYIRAGYAAGSWSGNGIATSLGDASSFGLGYTEFTAAGTFLGQPVAAGDVGVRYTRYGDANIDGNVNLQDFNALASNFGLSSNAVWNQGDFNYDGVINLQDFNRLAANFGLQAGPDGPTPEDWAELAGVVPEPATTAVFSAVLLSFRRRARRVLRRGR